MSAGLVTTVFAAVLLTKTFFKDITELKEASIVENDQRSGDGMKTIQLQVEIWKTPKSIRVGT